jgi:hypothetical protein
LLAGTDHLTPQSDPDRPGRPPEVLLATPEPTPCHSSSGTLCMLTLPLRLLRLAGDARATTIPEEKVRMARAARDASSSLESLEGLFEVGDHIPSVLDAHREAHEVLPDPEPLPPRRRELAVRGGGGMDGEGIDVS